MLEALGVPAEWFGRSTANYFVVVDSEDAVWAVKPDFSRLKQCFQGEVGVIVSSRSSHPECDVVSRYFAPAAGVDEDPVTGSSHCSIGPYWSQVLGKEELRAFQASARGGFMIVRSQGDRVYLRGCAVTVMQGKLGPAV